MEMNYTEEDLKRLKEGDVRTMISRATEDVIVAKAALKNCLEMGSYSFPIRDLEPENILAVATHLVEEAQSLLQALQSSQESLQPTAALATKESSHIPIKKEEKVIRHKRSAFPLNAVFLDAPWKIISNFQPGTTASAFSTAMIFESGQLQLFKHFYKGTKPLLLRPDDIYIALVNEHWELMKWIISKYYDLPDGVVKETMFHSVRKRNMDMLQWMFAKGHVNKYNSGCAMHTAVAVGDLAIVEFLQAQGYFPYVDVPVPFEEDHFGWSYRSINLRGVFQKEVIERGVTQVIQWLKQSRTQHASEPASRLRRYFLDNVNGNNDWHSFMLCAAKAGQTQMLQELFPPKSDDEWLFTRTCADCLDVAARGGHLATVEWLQHQAPNPMKCEKNIYGLDAMEVAAENGHLSVVEWLYKNPPPLLFRRQCHWGMLSRNVALENEKHHVVEWLQNNTSLGMV